MLWEREIYPKGKSRDAGNSIGNVPAYADGVVYVGGGYGAKTARAFRLAEDGRTIEDLDLVLIRPFQESMLVVDGKMYGHAWLDWTAVRADDDFLLNGTPFAEQRKRFHPGPKDATDKKQDLRAKDMKPWHRAGQGLMPGPCDWVTFSASLKVWINHSFSGLMLHADGMLYGTCSWTNGVTCLINRVRRWLQRAPVAASRGDSDEQKGTQGIQHPVDPRRKAAAPCRWLPVLLRHRGDHSVATRSVSVVACSTRAPTTISMTPSPASRGIVGGLALHGGNDKVTMVGATRRPASSMNRRWRAAPCWCRRDGRQGIVDGDLGCLRLVGKRQDPIARRRCVLGLGLFGEELLRSAVTPLQFFGIDFLLLDLRLRHAFESVEPGDEQRRTAGTRGVDDEGP